MSKTNETGSLYEELNRVFTKHPAVNVLTVTIQNDDGSLTDIKFDRIMKGNIHETQVKILALSKKEDLRKMTLREIGEKVGEEHPQSVKHHIEQLKKYGYNIKK